MAIEISIAIFYIGMHPCLLLGFNLWKREFELKAADFAVVNLDITTVEQDCILHD